MGDGGRKKEREITPGRAEIVGILCRVSGKSPSPWQNGRRPYARPSSNTALSASLAACLPACLLAAQSVATAKLLELTRDFLLAFPYERPPPTRFAI